MSMSNFIYVRSLRKVDFTVFGVDNGQKKYYDKTFGVYLPYSSGQQCKHSFIDELLFKLNEVNAPLTYNFEVNDNELKQKEITQPCDPTMVDQLLRGWMSSPSKKNDNSKKKSKKSSDVDDNNDTEIETNVETKNDSTYKRRSPFSISALTPVHPLLASLVMEKIITFDRSESNSENIVVRDKNNSELSDEEIQEFLNKNNKIITKRKLVTGSNKANGLFKSDVAIDLSKLFRVPIIKSDKEIDDNMITKLINAGWVEVETKFGKFLELPKQYHELYADAIAWSLVNWRITSNQSRTFDTMPILTIAVSDRANEMSSCVRGDIYDNGDIIKAKLVVDENYPNTKLFSTKLLNGYVEGARTSYTAIDDAANEIKNRILEYYK